MTYRKPAFGPDDMQPREAFLTMVAATLTANITDREAGIFNLGVKAGLRLTAELVDVMTGTSTMTDLYDSVSPRNVGPTELSAGIHALMELYFDQKLESLTREVRLPTLHDHIRTMLDVVQKEVTDKRRGAKP